MLSTSYRFAFRGPKSEFVSSQMKVMILLSSSGVNVFLVSAFLRFIISLEDFLLISGRRAVIGFLERYPDATAVRMIKLSCSQYFTVALVSIGIMDSIAFR